MKKHAKKNTGGIKSICSSALPVLTTLLCLSLAMFSNGRIMSKADAHPLMYYSDDIQLFDACEKCAGKNDAKACCKKASNKKAHKNGCGDKLHRAEGAKGCCAAGKQEMQGKCSSLLPEASPAEKNPAPVEQ